MSAPDLDLDIDAIAALAPDERRQFWNDARASLAGGEWEQAATAIWSDLLHDPDHAAEAWRGLTDPLPDGAVLARVLDISGPVHADLKFPVLEQLAAAPGWHDSIIRALWFALFEDHGDLDVPRARTLVAQLAPSIAVSEHEDVVSALEQLPDECRNFADWQDHHATADAAMPLFASARAKTELERRQGERRRRNVGPPTGMGERRSVPDRRGMWNSMSLVDPTRGDHADPSLEQPASAPRRVMVLVGCLVAGVLIALAAYALGVIPD